MPPDLKMASSPWRWCERLWSVPAAQRVVSTSFVLFIARTRAATICGEFMMACRLASFFDSWWTIIAAWLTTTWSSSLSSFVSSGMARVARSASSCDRGGVNRGRRWGQQRATVGVNNGDGTVSGGRRQRVQQQRPSQLLLLSYLFGAKVHMIISL